MSWIDGDWQAMGGEEGISLIEFSLSLVVLFTFMFCLMESCLALYSYDMISEMAREGTRYAMYRGASCPTTASPTCEVTSSQVNNFVAATTLPNLAGGSVTVATTYAASGSSSFSTSGSEAPGGRVKVTVTYVFPVKMPFVPTNSFTMSSTSVMPIVQ